MNEVVLGVVVGGAIGVGGSAIVAWIQAHYSQQQQSRQIQHEKDSQLLSRRIEVRSKYLEPLSSDLSKAYACLLEYEDRLVGMLVPYYKDEEQEEIHLPEANKVEFTQILSEVDSRYEETKSSFLMVFKGLGRIADDELLQRIRGLIRSLTGLAREDLAMRGSLQSSTTGQDFVYDFGAIHKAITEVQKSVSFVQYRIESLLAGVDHGREQKGQHRQQKANPKETELE